MATSAEELTVQELTKNAKTEERYYQQSQYQKFRRKVHNSAYAAGDWVKRNPTTTAAFIAAAVFSGLVSGGIIPLAALGLGAGGVFATLVGPALATSIQTGFSVMAQAMSWTVGGVVGAAMGIGLSAGIMVANKLSALLVPTEEKKGPNLLEVEEDDEEEEVTLISNQSNNDDEQKKNLVGSGTSTYEQLEEEEENRITLVTSDSQYDKASNGDDDADDDDTRYKLGDGAYSRETICNAHSASELLLSHGQFSSGVKRGGPKDLKVSQDEGLVAGSFASCTV